ncbi:MAG: glycosyltransferase family 4 protein [Corynebacterium camporealensis]|uniref:glycosyltransferase family 4 protein n=1 Tax=Corynebacterium camporealensis TaxID=161896 RepID=UPI002A911611|nr:glycosyltransferase family 4 protein [Corynebacterium camporealensis]MDY5839675.1 glycosyltransferase family 4 protein [Corynebacterium camporealensis]
MNKIAYIVKVYPRFSETFIVTEILGREAQGEDISIYAMRPTTDTRFHPELSRVKAPVSWIPRPHNARRFWSQVSESLTDPDMAARFAQILPELSQLAASDVAQGVALAQRVRADGITHLHAHFASLSGRMAWIASQLTGIGYTLTTHAKDIFHDDVDKTWLRRICADADNVIAISRFNENYLRAELEGAGANIVQRYNALELERFPFTPRSASSTALRIIAVGRLVPKKGFSHLLQALRQLTDRGVEAHLTLVGEGELQEQLDQEVHDLGLDEHVTMPGALNQAEVIDLLQQSDVFAAPCVPAADGNLDGLPTVVLEAMALGTPVLATDVTGLPEVVINNDTGVLITLDEVEPDLATALADALESFSNGDLDTETLTRNARRLIEDNFDNRLQAQALYELEVGSSCVSLTSA